MSRRIPSFRARDGIADDFPGNEDCKQTVTQKMERAWQKVDDLRAMFVGHEPQPSTALARRKTL